MKFAFLALVALHGLIHLMGPVKAFGLSDLPQLTTPISRPAGLAWSAAAIGLLTTAALMAVSSRWWWMAGAVSVVLSQAVILSAWSDAKFGTIPNLILLAVVAYGFMSEGPSSFAAEYRRDVDQRVNETSVEARRPDRDASPEPEFTLVTEVDLTPLPDPVRRYIRRTGSVGEPRVHRVHTAWRGRIRAGPDDPWMEFTAIQDNFVHEPARFFLMDARKAGLPVDVLHAFRDGAASMRVRLLSMIPLVSADGPEMTRAETVTLLNDMVLLFPSALADPRLGPYLRWDSVDDTSARVHYTVGDNEVSALLTFNDADELIDFVSDDRLAASPDGGGFAQWRWSTPVEDYRSFGDLRLMSRGEGLWHAPEGTYSYIELELLEHVVNGGP